MVIVVDFKPRNHSALASHLEKELKETAIGIAILRKKEDLDEYNAGRLREYVEQAKMLKNVLEDMYKEEI